MTQFNRNQFIYEGGHLSYAMSLIVINNPNGSETILNDRSKAKFIARFKYSTRDKAGFMSFLIKNFTVEEYLGRLAAGESPAPILESKGYVSATVGKILERAGYPKTRAGHDAYIDVQVKASLARYPVAA